MRSSLLFFLAFSPLTLACENVTTYMNAPCPASPIQSPIINLSKMSSPLSKIKNLGTCAFTLVPLNSQGQQIGEGLKVFPNEIVDSSPAGLANSEVVKVQLLCDELCSGTALLAFDSLQ